MTIVQLEKLLKSTTGGPLEALVQKAAGMERLLAALKAALEPAMASRLTGVNLRPDGELVLVADSPAWAARLRFEADKLMSAAKESGARVTACKVIVAKNQPGP
jgi:hypothetical protein